MHVLRLFTSHESNCCTFCSCSVNTNMRATAIRHIYPSTGNRKCEDRLDIHINALGADFKFPDKEVSLYQIHGTRYQSVVHT